MLSARPFFVEETMGWREDLAAQRQTYVNALANQDIYPGMNWPESQRHYLDLIEQITRILGDAHDEDTDLPDGRITRLVS